ncbi:MAG: PilT/PilU family type 4a pilus ATPase [Gammaproteobacteria bacterium]|nr:PilT/PilU family type 4a pilus ATPase [Gammaproteobacteria bacterium]
MDIRVLLKIMVQKGASDLFITAGVAPSFKLNGELLPIAQSALPAAQAEQLVTGIMDEKQLAEFYEHRECNFAIEYAGIGRFRVSAFVQRGHPGMVLRRIETTIPSIADLHLPKIIPSLSLTKRGLIVVVGATGSGKSTTLASMIGHRNENTGGHIITIEDPIEFVHPHKRCIVSQREVGVDTESFEVALKNTLRQAPDVILIGEVRTRETMEYAINFAETGHLAMCTLHANNANQALDRIIHFFPEDRRQQLLMDLSLNMKAIVAQQLLPAKSGKGRRLAAEVLLNTPFVSELIRRGDMHKIKDIMKRSRELGMQTFDQALYDLYQRDEITAEAALAHADSSNDVRLMIKLGSGDVEAEQVSDGPKPDAGNLSLM